MVPSEGNTHLPVFGDGVPDSHLPRVTGGDQLVADEEEGLHWHVQAEDACGGEKNPDRIDLLHPNQQFQMQESRPAPSSLRLAPISLPLPSGQMDHRMMSVPEATATILSLSPSEPAITLALSATLSITQSRRGEVKTCCQPVDSFTLGDNEGGEAKS